MPDTWGVRPPEGKITANFSWDEARCRCGCGRVAGIEVVKITAQWLEQVRAVFNKPIHINSWCRCPEHNAKLPGAAKHSYHMTGMAVDITIRGLTPFQVWFKLRWKHWGVKKLVGGLGRYASFTHVDRRAYAAKWGGDE